MSLSHIIEVSLALEWNAMPQDMTLMQKNDAADFFAQTK